MKQISLDRPAGVRATAATVLASLLSQRGSLATQLPRPSASADGNNSMALLKELCYGACRWYYQLNSTLEGLVDKPLKQKDLDIHCLIIVGMYQLAYMRIPEYVSINETVNACVLLKKAWAKGLINAVLRKFQRLATADQLSYTEDASFYSYPNWLVCSLKTEYPDHWQHILAAGNSHPPMTLRVNLQLCSREGYLGMLAEHNIAAHAGTISDSAVYLQSPCAVDMLPGFREGYVSVQDEASQLLPSLLMPGDGQRILDACAAPGGKTCHLLETTPALAQIVALDIEPRRLERLHENLQRLQLSGARVKVIGADATVLDDWWDGECFDRILLDAPCSATGIIRRQPDIKLLRQATDIDRLILLQASLLDRLWTCLKPGGLLVYSTCSIMPAENSQQIGAFLNRTANAVSKNISQSWGLSCTYGRQLLPADNSTDGFFFALLQKSDLPA
jgi:16S rRNA (cytosine967-C5)-methyltransferase